MAPVLPATVPVEITNVSFVGTGYTLYLEAAEIPEGSNPGQVHTSISYRDGTTQLIVTSFVQLPDNSYFGAITVDRDKVQNSNLQWVRDNITVRLDSESVFHRPHAATPTSTPRPQPTATPTPTPVPTPTQVPWGVHTGKGDEWGYTVTAPRNWRSARGGKQAELRSSDGRATLTIGVKDYPEKLPPQQFAEEHRASLIAKYAYDANFFNILDFRGVFLDGNQWFRLSWRLQQKSDSCVLDITDLVSRSRNFPGWDNGYIVSFRVCDEHLPAHLKDRKRILDSFRELAP